MEVLSTTPWPAAGPKGHPLLGCTLPAARDPLEFLRACARERGDLVPLRVLGKRVLFVNHPDYVAQVLAASHRKVVKGITRRSDSLILGDGISLSEGPSWLRQRRQLQPSFHRDRVAAYSRDVVALSARLVDEWHDEEVRDVHAEMGKLALAIVGKTLLGVDVWNEAPELGDALADLLACRDAHARSPSMLLPTWFPTPTNVRIRGARRRIDAILQKLIDRRRSRGEDGDDLLAALLETDDGDGLASTDRHVRNQIVTILVGGHETVTDLLSWSWYLLSEHPEAEAKLLAELDATLDGRLPTHSDLQNLPYTGMLTAEVLRLYPPAAVLTREATEDFDVGASRVARGTEIVMSPWVLQRDARFFPDPEVFDPERWADGLAGRLPRYAYFPFGGGPRLCLGRSMALMEATLILATIAPRFRLDLRRDHPVVPDPIPTLHPRFGLKMTVRTRERRTDP